MTTADDNQTDVFASVQMLPSGHRVEVPPGVSIVEAALSAGIYVPYGCNNGTCGDCVARVVSGELVTCRHSDYVIDAARKQQDRRRPFTTWQWSPTKRPMYRNLVTTPQPVQHAELVSVTVVFQVQLQIQAFTWTTRQRDSQWRRSGQPQFDFLASDVT